MSHILILDIGKTNKKCFVFDEDYQVVFEKSTSLPETTDEDGFPCEDLNLLTIWVKESLENLINNPKFNIRAINCTTYGASFVHLDAEGNPLTPLYNYLKPFPDDLKKQFFDTYGGEEKMALETASPVLGMLNSGLQLYWLKYHKPLIFNKIQRSVHLPQFIAMNLGKALNPFDISTKDMTSIGCHTMLWDFQKNDYHHWVKAEGIVDKFPQLHYLPNEPMNQSTNEPMNQSTNQPINQSKGLHDSSAALIPYLMSFQEPFVLISTGTWCISLNPFNNEPLTAAELKKDCLCYLTFEGKLVKAARYFGGNEHDKWVKDLAKLFDKPLDYYKTIPFDFCIYENFDKRTKGKNGKHPFENYEEAYHLIVLKLLRKQCYSTNLILTKEIKRIFIDGGFSKNEIYMNLLAKMFPKLEIFAAEVAQATALGAALAVHDSWNEKTIPANLIHLKRVL
jgi:L-fuculokinase